LRRIALRRKEKIERARAEACALSVRRKEQKNMRIVVQRVTRSSVTIKGELISEIGKGLMALIGVQEGDTEKDAQLAAEKIAGLRIFEDEAGKMNLSVQDIGGEVLAVSQFTLLGDARKGKRPSFIEAARPEIADPLYEKVVENIRAAGLTCKTGVFRADMQVELINDGPVTILYDTRRLF